MFDHTSIATPLRHQEHQTTADPFESRFGAGHRLPMGLREEAAGMSWSLFTATYCPTPATRIAHLDATRLRAGRYRFHAELVTYSKTNSPHTLTEEITCTGPVAACTHLLANAGRYVEILTFRQHQIFEATVTFVEVAHQHDHLRTAWAVGFGSTPAASAAAALSSGAHRIHD